MFWRSLLLISLVLSTCAGVSVESATAAILWRGDFATGNLEQWNFGSQSKSPNRIVVARASQTNGRYAARFTVRPGDTRVAGSGPHERAEVLQFAALTNGSEGEEQWWAWSTRFAKQFRPAAGFNIFTQWHHTGSRCSPPVAFYVRGKKLGVSTRGGRLRSDCSYPHRGGWTLVDKLNKKRWYDFVFHVKWSSKPDVGFVELWVNGELVVPKTRVATLYRGQSVYVKQGLYRSGSRRPAVVFHHGMRLGESRGDVR